MYSFPNLEPVCCSMSSSNCCFLTCIQISQEAGQVVWYSHLFKSFPQFFVIHKVKGFGTVNKVEVDVFLELSCFFDDSTDVCNLISGSPAFSKSTLNIWNFTVHILLKFNINFIWSMMFNILLLPWIIAIISKGSPSLYPWPLQSECTQQHTNPSNHSSLPQTLPVFPCQHKALSLS